MKLKIRKKKKRKSYPWVLLVFIFLLAFLAYRKLKVDRGEKKLFGYDYQHNHQKFSNDETYRCRWKCDYCNKVIEHGKKDPRPYWDEVRPELNALFQEHLSECEEAQKTINYIDTKKDNNLVYDDEEKILEKGYDKYLDIDRIKNWGLINRVILPGLREEKRIGIVNFLETVSGENIDKYGSVGNLVTFLIPRATPVIKKELSNLLAKDKINFFYAERNAVKDTVAYERVIVTFFVWKILKKKESWLYNIYTLKTDREEKNPPFAPVKGNSDAVTRYLSLLSAYHQRPISKEVAATAVLDIGKYSKMWCTQCFQRNELAKNLEENFTKNKIIPVSGLKYKIPAAVKAGVKKLILSNEQKENYEKEVSQNTRKQLTVYYVKNVEELEELFWSGELS